MEALEGRVYAWFVREFREGGGTWWLRARARVRVRDGERNEGVDRSKKRSYGPRHLTLGGNGNGFDRTRLTWGRRSRVHGLDCLLKNLRSRFELG